ncbi:MAG: S41 family peptidase [Azospirillaceae bacterium]|nr:S41 family peptidase [Azospirillaceae bacterium]
MGRFTLAALLCAGFCFPAWAQAPVTLSADQRAVTVAAVIAQLKETYVFPDKVPALVAALEKAKAAGRYDVDNPTTLAARLTDDMHDAAHDHHLYINYDPVQYEAAKHEGDAGPDVTPDQEAYFRAEAARDNSGLVETRILPGNIRYLRISGFQWVDDETGFAYDAALRFLKGGDAVIIDERGNGGGDHSAVRYLLSHFMDSGAPLMTFTAAGLPSQQSYTLDHLAAGRLKGKPLYVLVDNNVGSAAEEFAYSVQQFHLGQVVGARTVGAANNNRIFPIAPGFMLSVSFGRPEHPVSHGNWEGTGVVPDVAVADWGQTLDMAQSLALTQLLKASDIAPQTRADGEWAQVPVEARLHPPAAIAPTRLKGWAGHYGDRTEVGFRDGILWYQPAPDAPPRRLTLLSTDGLFAIEGNDKVRARFTTAGLETYMRGNPTPRVQARR